MMPGAEHIPEKLRWNPVTYIKEAYFGGRYTDEYDRRLQCIRR